MPSDRTRVGGPPSTPPATPPAAPPAAARQRLAGVPAFRPRWPWIGADLQTLRDSLVPAPGNGPAAAPRSVVARDVTFAMTDGTGDRLAGVLEQPPASRPGRPLAILIHGLTGCADSRYVRRAAGRLQDAGYRTLRLNLRGAGPSRAFCREQYHSGRTGDLEAVLRQLPADLLGEGVVLVGWSLGANMLLKALAEFGTEHPIRGAVSISAPIHLAEAAERIRAPRNRPYHWWLLRRMKQEAAAAPAPVAGELRERLAAVRNIVEFDERITAPRNGFAGAADYYARCSALRFLAAIPVPTLVVHALDDPWIPGRAYEHYDWSRNRNLLPLLSAQGGHVGFHAAGGRVWSDDRTVDFLDTLSSGEITRP